jgi:hypothetical protein
MPGLIPGIPGVIAFAGVKFGGYCLAGMALRRFQPAITASAVKIAAYRTGLGVLIGPPLTIGLLALTSMVSTQDHAAMTIGFFAFLYILRLFIWALVVRLFTKQIALPRPKFWGYSALGALWSCLLDVPGLALAFITPGQVPIC